MPTFFPPWLSGVAFAAAEGDRLGIKALIMQQGRWGDEWQRLDDEHHERNMALLAPEIRETIDHKK